jgi:hypothetical protein
VNAETATIMLNTLFLQAKSASLRTRVKEIVTLLGKSKTSGIAVLRPAFGG